MNGPLDVRRAVALVTTPSETVAEVRAATGTTVNEVVLAVTAGALRSYLAARDELPERPLVVAVPTSLRARGEAAVSGNRVSALLSHLPVHVEDPVARLEHTVAATRDAKAVAEAVDPETIPRWTDLLPPAVTSGVVRGATATGLVEALPPVVNLVVSNVPGPPVPLFLGGARVEHAFATGPIFTPVGCNLTVLSYLSSIEWSLLVAPGRVPDLHLLARAVPAALEEVHAATR